MFLHLFQTNEKHKFTLISSLPLSSSLMSICLDDWSGSALDYERFFEEDSTAETEFPILVTGEIAQRRVYGQ